MSSYLYAAEWVTSVLASDPAVAGPLSGPDGHVRVYEGMAPVQAGNPLVTVQSYTPARDVNFNGGRRALTTVEVLVRVWDTADAVTGGDYSRILDIATAIDRALHGARPVNTPLAHIAGCVRTMDMPETVARDGVIDRALGGLYEVTVSPLA